MPRRDAEAGRVFLGLDRSGTEERALLVAVAFGQGAVDDRHDLLAAEDADDVIDAGHFGEEVVLLAFGETAGDDDGTDAALLFQCQHLADDAERFLPSRFDEAAGVDDDDVGAVGVRREHEAVLGELAEHALGIDEVLRAAEADEGVGARIRHRVSSHSGPIDLNGDSD